jgi:hypothetical protein
MLCSVFERPATAILFSMKRSWGNASGNFVAGVVLL